MEKIDFKLESDVNDYVKNKLNSLGLKKLVDYNEESAMSDYMKEALKGSAKTKNKTNFGKPDFHIEKYDVPIIIENKLDNKFHIAENKSGIKMDEKSIRDFAVNGAIYYAKNMIASKKYKEVIAIGITGKNNEDIKISVYYVFSSLIAPKKLNKYSTLDFVENKKSFNEFYKDAIITESEKHSILVKTRDEILHHAKKLNKLMNNHNIGIDQRVVYVSGMLLAMQDVIDDNGDILNTGLIPDDLKGIQTAQNRDSIIIIKHLEECLDQKKAIDSDKRKIMLDSFKMALSLDSARDNLVEIDKTVGNLLKQKASITKQIFIYLYHYIYLSIDLTNGALDIMAEMYSTFLKYALSDGASLGKVLTPPYITSVMAKILDINKNSKVMDLATGSAAFLVAAMDIMIEDANNSYGKETTKANNIIKKIKEKQLLGIEIDAKMYTLAATNMILRGDGSTQIKKANTFKTPKELYNEFQADVLLLNPPFSYNENGMPFFEFGLDHMKKGGKAAIIIQDSAGSGKAIQTNQRILSKHRMIASIKMPSDLFIPNAIVQTSIYVFEAKVKHNFESDLVKFIDFRNDGYKRTERGINEVDFPAERYSDLYLIFKMGYNAEKSSDFHKDLWDIDNIYCEDLITNSGKDWNFEQHKKSIKTPKDKDYYKSIANHYTWEIGNLLNHNNNINTKKLNLKEFLVKDVFTIEKTQSYNKDALLPIKKNDLVYDYITRTAENRGICSQTSYIGQRGLNEKGTFSLGLLQMTFFYRENQWYAGQFMRKIKCKYEINKYHGIYLETVLSGLSNYLLSGLVRDVDDGFLEAKIKLPVNKKGEIDFIAMENYVINYYRNMFKVIYGKYSKI